MGFSQYPDNIVTTIYVDEEIQLSDITVDADTQIAYLGLQIFKYGLSNNVDLYIKAYDTSDNFIAQSERVDIEDFPTETDYFYGWVYFRFDPRVNMPDTSAIRFKLYLEGYTFSEAFWVGAVYDWPITMGYNDNPDQIQDSPFALDIIGAN